jgi:hypothetical protein
MTKAKEHHPGQLVELSRSPAHRAFFWRPGTDTRYLFGYLYGKAANDHGQQPHVACLMSNHPHLLHTDTTGRRSDFMQQLHYNTARKRNLQLGFKSCRGIGASPSPLFGQISAAMACPRSSRSRPCLLRVSTIYRSRR